MTNQSTIKELRELTGAGILDVKEALSEAGGSVDQAVEILRKKGVAKLTKKADRIAKEGLVESYIHPGSRVGALVEVNCETDFVARTDEFKNLAKDLALHIAASNPLYVSKEDVPAEVIEKEKEIYKEQSHGKSGDVADKMVLGKLEKYFEEVCLMEQAFVKNPDKKISQVIADATSQMGENVQVRRFARFVLGN